MKFPLMKMRKPTSGFTLIELLVVMGVILILAGIVVGVQRGVYHQQSQARAKADLQAIANALETFKLKYGDYPWLGADDASSTGSQVDKNLFKVLTGNGVLRRTGMQYGSDAEPLEVPPLLDESLIEVSGTGNDKHFVDPWGSAYKYYYKSNAGTTWNHSGFILMSLGPDRDIGGASGGNGSGQYNFSNGTFPQNANEYAGDPADNNRRYDNLIYGLEIQ